MAVTGLAINVQIHAAHSVFIMSNVDDENQQQEVRGVIGDKELYHTLLGKMMLQD